MGIPSFLFMIKWWLCDLDYRWPQSCSRARSPQRAWRGEGGSPEKEEGKALTGVPGFRREKKTNRNSSDPFTLLSCKPLSGDGEDMGAIHSSTGGCDELSPEFRKWCLWCAEKRPFSNRAGRNPRDSWLTNTHFQDHCNCCTEGFRAWVSALGITVFFQLWLRIEAQRGQGIGRR